MCRGDYFPLGNRNGSAARYGPSDPLQYSYSTILLYFYVNTHVLDDVQTEIIKREKRYVRLKCFLSRRERESQRGRKIADHSISAELYTHTHIFVSLHKFEYVRAYLYICISLSLMRYEVASLPLVIVLVKMLTATPTSPLLLKMVFLLSLLSCYTHYPNPLVVAYLPSVYNLVDAAGLYVGMKRAGFYQNLPWCNIVAEREREKERRAILERTSGSFFSLISSDISFSVS